MRIPCHVLLILVLSFICSQAGVVKRQPGKKTELAMDFFEEFNNLFGYDWWGSGTADDDPEQEVVTRNVLIPIRSRRMMTWQH
jgi:hypothetical protein